MEDRRSLLNEIDKRYSHKKVYERKEGYYPNKKKFDMSKDEQYLIKTRVESMCKEISQKYEVEESELYEKLYLRVRKLFLELM